MPWVKLDDAFFDNVKVIRAGRDARDLYLAGLCFCARQLTDGFIPEGQVPRLAADASVEGGAALAAKLVDVGLWTVADGGYEVHDYLVYNPSREQSLALRQARAEAGSVGGLRSVASKRQAKAQANATANGVANFNPVPVPVPGPVPSPEPVSDRERHLRGEADASPALADGRDGQRLEVAVPTEGGTRSDTPGRTRRQPKATTPTEAEPREDRQMWAVLCKLHSIPAGYDWRKQSEARGKFNTAISRLREAGVTPDALPGLYQTYLRRFGKAPPTPMAVVGQLPILLAPEPVMSANGRGASQEVLDGDNPYIRKLEGRAVQADGAAGW